MRFRHRVAVAATLTCSLCASSLVFAEGSANWPHWRGPQGNGVSEGQNTPVSWSRTPEKTENILWRLSLPGPAGATPVVWGERIFLTSVGENGDDLLLLCVDTSGKLLWSDKVGSGNKKVRSDEGNYASPSPITDGSHVLTFMANGLLACYDFDGKQLWKKDLQKDYGTFDIQFGLSSSPVLHGGKLFVQLIHGPWNKKQHVGLVVALDTKTGKQVWKHERVTDAVDECKHSYASPMLYADDKQQFLITHGADYVIAHNLETGKEIWRCGGLNPKGAQYGNTLRFVASPAAAPGLIVVPTAKNRKVVAIRPDGKGDITNSKEHIVWVMPSKTPDVPSPVIQGGLVYLCRENGNLMAVDAKSGKLLYEKLTTRDRHRGSPVYADGKIYLTARNGVVSVVKAGREFEMLAQNSLGEPTTASPVIVGGRIYLRTFKALYAIGSK
ncbi:MAG: PQQ-binding-like beta-propeller repeat protein [Pirellulales bacterium]